MRPALAPLVALALVACSEGDTINVYTSTTTATGAGGVSTSTSSAANGTTTGGGNGGAATSSTTTSTVTSASSGSSGTGQGGAGGEAGGTTTAMASSSSGGCGAPDECPAGGECEEPTCVGGVCALEPAAKGEVCSEAGGHLCDGAACVAFIPVQCVVNGQTYTGCDGQNHPGQHLYTSTSNCNLPTDYAYCAPGETCSVVLNGQNLGVGDCL